MFEPESSTLSGPFWEATRERRLVLPWCTGCERAVWFPREVCPNCRGTTFDWRPALGEGEVHTVLTGGYASWVGSWGPGDLRPGQALEQPRPLFTKLDPSVADEELARMTGP